MRSAFVLLEAIGDEFPAPAGMRHGLVVIAGALTLTVWVDAKEHRPIMFNEDDLDRPVDELLKDVRALLQSVKS